MASVLTSDPISVPVRHRGGSLSVGWARVVLAGCLLLTGCSAPPRPAWERAGAQEVQGAQDLSQAFDRDPHAAGRRWSGSVAAVAARRGDLANGRLQLPAVSPDGVWIAYLMREPGDTAASPRGLLDGRGLGAVSLWVRRVDASGPGTEVARGGACWPVWSADAHSLFFIKYDAKLGCTLGRHDVAAGTTRRHGVGLRRMMMPAPSPDGSRVAVSAYGEVPEDAVVMLIDLERGVAVPGPPPTPGGGGAQVQPRWFDDQTLLYVELERESGVATQRRWTLGADTSAEIAALGTSLSVYEAPALTAGIAGPLAPSRDRLAWYMPSADRTEVVSLAGEDALALDSGTRSGLWWDARWWAAATDQGVELVATDGGGDHRPLTLRLLPGRWAPLWAGGPERSGERSMILVGPAESPDLLAVMQLWLVVKGE